MPGTFSLAAEHSGVPPLQSLAWRHQPAGNAAHACVAPLHILLSGQSAVADQPPLWPPVPPVLVPPSPSPPTSAPAVQTPASPQTLPVGQSLSKVHGVHVVSPAAQPAAGVSSTWTAVGHAASARMNELAMRAIRIRSSGNLRRISAGWVRSCLTLRTSRDLSKNRALTRGIRGSGSEGAETRPLCVQPHVCFARAGHRQGPSRYRRARALLREARPIAW